MESKVTLSPEDYIRQNSQVRNEPSWLLNKRLEALSTFKEKPMPSFVYGLNINLKVDLKLEDLELINAFLLDV